jgi:acyl-CoA reductase-like NAD-dependent aldehyde dehydrogenase
MPELPPAAQPSHPPDTRLVVAGERVQPSAADCFRVTDPWTGGLLAEVPDCGAPDVDRAVAAARLAFESASWAGLSTGQRADLLSAFAARVAARAPELAMLDSRQMGMPLALAEASIQGAAAALSAQADQARAGLDVRLSSAGTALAVAAARPLGVVAAITAWNFPVPIALGRIGAVLLAGNSLVLKPSEIAPLGCLRLGDLAAEAGIPSGVLNIVPGRGTTAGAALASHGDVDALAFTGSTATGRLLMQAAGASNLKRLHLECGGKSPQILFDDLGDAKGLAGAVVAGFTHNSGQLCTAGSRILIHETLFDRLLPLIAERVAALSTGNPMAPEQLLGPLASRAHTATVERLVGQALPGDRCVAEGQTSGRSACEFAPRLFVGEDPASPLVQQELFGPVAIATRFRDPDDAIRLANATPYGLSATLWSRDMAALMPLAHRLKAGFVIASDSVSPADPGVSALPGEPAGQSGFGVEGGLQGVAAFTRLQGVLFQSKGTLQ